MDVIIDGVGGTLTGGALGCLLPAGTYAVVGYAGGREASVNLDHRERATAWAFPPATGA